MPSVTQLPSGRFRAQVYVKGQRDSQVFRTKREAVTWGRIREVELSERASKAPAELHTLDDLLCKFRDEVTEHKRGKVKEKIRIEMMRRLLPVHLSVSDVTPETIKSYRDLRSQTIKPNSVLRELGLLSALFTYAVEELKWIASNPLREVKKPERPKHREVVISWRQVKRMLQEFHYTPACKIDGLAKSIAVLFLFCLRTGARAGEACGLNHSQVFEDYFHVSSKTPAGNRDIPITPKIRRLLDRMRGYDPISVFGINPGSLDAMFRKYRNRAGLEGFTFHDSRHTAATWMVKYGKLNVLELCKIFGWTDPKMAMVYFNPSPRELAARMSGR